MVFAVNSLLYLNQSVPPYGVALNSLTSGTTAFPLRECASGRAGGGGRWGRGGCWVPDTPPPPQQAPRRACGSLLTVPRRPSSPTTRWSSPSRAERCESPFREPCTPSVVVPPAPAPGALPSSASLSHSYVLTLITDGMRSVRAFHFDKAAASVLTSSVSGGCGQAWVWVQPQSPLTTAPPASDGHHGAWVPVPWLSPGQLPPSQVHGEAAGGSGQCCPGGR